MTAMRADDLDKSDETRAIREDNNFYVIFLQKKGHKVWGHNVPNFYEAI